MLEFTHISGKTLAGVPEDKVSAADDKNDDPKQAGLNKNNK